MKKSLGILLSVVFSLLIINTAYSAMWSDNFTGGASQQEWGHTSCGGDNSTWGVDELDRFQIHTESIENLSEGEGFYVNFSGSNATIQSRVQRINEGDKYLAAVGLRGNIDEKSYYQLVVSSESPNWVWINKIINNQVQFLKSVQISAFNQFNCIVKFRAEGDHLYGKVWTYNTEEPVDWQIETIDTSLTCGVGGIGVSTSAGYGFYNAQAAFDDVVFTTDSVSPEVTEVTLSSNPSSDYLFLYDHDQVEPYCHIDGLWIEPGQLSSATSSPPSYEGACGPIAREYNCTLAGSQEDSYGALMLSIAGDQASFVNERSLFKTNMPINENEKVFGKWGGNEGPINKNNINLRGIPVGTTVTFTVKMNNEIPHALAVMGGSMPNVIYDPAGFSNTGQLTITTTTCRPTSNEGWTPNDSVVGFLIFTNPDYGINHIGLIGQANHWAGDCFILLPGYDYGAPIDAGDIGAENAKVGLTLVGPTGQTRDVNIFFPDRAIGGMFGPGINEDEIMAFVNNNPNYEAEITPNVMNFSLEGTLAEFECTFHSPVAVSFGVPASVDTEWTDDFDGGIPDLTWVETANLGANNTALFLNNRYEFHVENPGLPGDAMLFSGISGPTFTDATFQCTVQQIAPSDPFVAVILLRGDSVTKDGYSFYVANLSPGNQIIGIVKQIGGVKELLGSQQLLIDLTNFQFKCEVIGTSLYAKAWPTGGSEPAAWNVSAINSELTSGGCAIGLVGPQGFSSPVQVAFDDVSLTADLPVTCTYLISPKSKGFSVSGGTGMMNVDASDNSCDWAAAVNAPADTWIHITSGSGPGDAAVNFTVDANPDALPRTGTLTIAGETFTVSQCGTGGVDVWSDDFDGVHPADPNQQTWINVDQGDNSSASFVDGRYVLHTENLTSSSLKTLASYVGKCASDAMIQAHIMGGANASAVVHLRADLETGSQYGAGVFSASGVLAFFKPVNGIPTQLTSIAVPDVDLTNCQLKFAAIGDKLYAKVWTDGTAEPIDWTLEYTDTGTDILYGFGGIRVVAGPLSSAEVTVDDVSLTTDLSSVCASLMILWNGNLVVDFGEGRGLFMQDGSGWTQLTGWGDVHKMLVWGTNLVVDFGGSRGLFVNNGSGWTQLTGWDDTSNMLVWNNGTTNNLVVDFGGGRGLYYNDGTTWNLLTGWDDTSNMLVWDNGVTNNLVVDFGQGRGLYYNNGATWNLLTGWDDTSNMMVWNTGAENRLVVEFGGGRGLYYNDGTNWTLLTGWDGTNRMLVWNNNLVVDFGGGRGLYYNDGTWHELTGWDDTADMTTWNTGASNRLVVDFGGGRGLYYNDGSSWNNLTGYDDTHRIITWGNNLVVDFGGGRGLYYNDGTWHELMAWDDTAELLEWDASLVSDFGPGKGVYKYSGGSWTELTGWSTAE